MLTTQKIIGTIGYMGGIMSLPEPFTYSWGNMLVYAHESLCQENEHIGIDRAKMSLHDYARNELADRMRGDWLLMLDTDVSFDPDFAARLVAAMRRFNVDVLTGIYSYKKPPHYPVLYMYNHETERNEIVSNWDQSVEIFNVDSAGAGCLLVRRKVFDRIRHELHERPFDRYGAKGEDHSFFARLRKLGVRAYCAWKIEMEHLEYMGVSPSANYTPGFREDHFYSADGLVMRQAG